MLAKALGDFANFEMTQQQVRESNALRKKAISIYNSLGPSHTKGDLPLARTKISPWSCTSPTSSFAAAALQSCSSGNL